MRIIRFDAEVGFDIRQHGSDFRISPLTGPAPSVMRVHVMHLPPGGRIGRHPTAVTQLLCCVAGEGWVTGADGRARRLGPGQGAWWDAGEEHETWTDGGMTAIGVEGEMRVLAAVRWGDPVVVVDHDPTWTAGFERIRSFLAPALGDLPLSIEHVGSTAVPGLAAKPVIDVDVVVRSDDDFPAVIDALRSIGYLHRGDLGIAGRPAFRLLAETDLPKHHLYAVVEGSTAHLDHVLLRDLLRASPADAARYAEVKREAATAADDDIEAYGAAKHAFVEDLLDIARARAGIHD